MFERCDAHATAIVESAIDEARQLGHRYIGTEHLLLAITQHRATLPATVAGMLPDADAIRAAITDLIGQPSTSDAEMLRTLGIDLDGVRAAVRRTFGDDALERIGRRRVHQPWQPWRRPTRRCTSMLAGNLGAAPRFKQAFERACHEADRRQHATIDPATLLLGMVHVEDALSNRLLRERGVDPAEICRLLAAS